MSKSLCFILIIFVMLCNVSFSQESELVGIINSSIVRIDVMWGGAKNCYSYSLGVLVSSDGTVLTCYHCIGDDGKTPDSINIVFLENGKKISYPARIIDIDKWRDLAILRPCEKKNFKCVTKFKVKDNISPEEYFYASMKPENPWNTITPGTLAYSALNDKGRQVMGFNMKIRSGCSGSGLFDSSGNVVGLIYATARLDVSQKNSLSLVIPGQSLIFFLERNDIIVKSEE